MNCFCVCARVDVGLWCGRWRRTRDLEPHFPLSLRVGVTAATNFSSNLGHEDRAVWRHNEAREALVLSLAGVTAIMLIANLILMILY